ncbi:MAG: LPS-assembly protein LptD [Acidobacteriota bacterium]
MSARWPPSCVAVLALLATPFAMALDPPRDAVSLHAASQQWIQDTLWCGTGNVEIFYQDISLRCDEVEVDQATLTVRARGNVVLDQGPTRIACDRLEFDLKSKTGTLWDVTAVFPPSYSLRAKVVEKLDESRYRFEHGVFTSCATSEEGEPAWTIEAREGRLELEGYGHFVGAALKARGIPVIYIPRMIWPVKQERAFGLLVPRFGSNSRQGAYLGNSLFWPISRSFDTTFFLDLYSKGFVEVGQEARWAPAENAAGELTAMVIRNPRYDPATDPHGRRWEWKAEGKHHQLFPSGYVLRAELNELSNLDFFQSFERSFERNAQRTLYSHLTLSRSWGPQTANLKIDHQRTFFDSGQRRQVVVLDRLPELEYRLRASRLGTTPIYASAVGTANHFRVDRQAGLRAQYQRLDLYPTLALLLPGFTWLNLTPTAGARLTHYTATYSGDRRTLVDEPLTRTYFTGGLSFVGPSVSRVWSRANGNKLKHLIEPRLDYAYVSDPGDASRIHVFDQKDLVQVSNRLTWNFSNRLFFKSGDTASRELATFEVSQDYSFSQPLTPALPGSPASQSGPLSFWLRVSPALTTNLDARATVDPVTRNLRSTSLSGTLSRAGAMAAVTWYSSYSPTTGDITSSQTRLAGGYGPPTGAWRIESGIVYDIHRAELLEQRYLLRWKASCWAALVELRDYRIAPYQRRDVRLLIDLTGLGTILDSRTAF